MEIQSEAFVFNCTIYIEGSTCEYHDKDRNDLINDANVKMNFPSHFSYDSTKNADNTCEKIKISFSGCMRIIFHKVCLVTARHNELRDGVSDLTGKAFTPSHVQNDPLIYSGRAVKRKNTKPAGSSGNKYHTAAPPPEFTEQKCDLLIRDLWQQGIGSVHDMRVVNTDIQSHRKKDPEKCLQEAERGKKRMYLESCLQQRRHFSPFVSLVYGLMGVEETATLKRLASRLATKWNQYNSKTCGYVKSRIAITLVRATHCCIRGSQVPAHWISVQRPQWEDDAGLNLSR